MDPHEPTNVSLTSFQRRVVTLLRSYARCRAEAAAVLPRLTGDGARLGMAPGLVVALASVFQLTEGCLGRRLATLRLASASLDPDERATLAMLAAGGRLDGLHGTAEVPHGLPGALVWAIRSVRALGGDPAPNTAGAMLATIAVCPFRTAGRC